MTTRFTRTALFAAASSLALTGAAYSQSSDEPVAG